MPRIGHSPPDVALPVLSRAEGSYLDLLSTLCLTQPKIPITFQWQGHTTDTCSTWCQSGPLDPILQRCFPIGHSSMSWCLGLLSTRCRIWIALFMSQALAGYIQSQAVMEWGKCTKKAWVHTVQLWLLLALPDRWWKMTYRSHNSCRN